MVQRSQDSASGTSRFRMLRGLSFQGVRIEAAECTDWDVRWKQLLKGLPVLTDDHNSCRTCKVRVDD